MQYLNFLQNKLLKCNVIYTFEAALHVISLYIAHPFETPTPLKKLSSIVQTQIQTSHPCTKCRLTAETIDSFSHYSIFHKVTLRMTLKIGQSISSSSSLY